MAATERATLFSSPVVVLRVVLTAPWPSDYGDVAYAAAAVMDEEGEIGDSWQAWVTPERPQHPDVSPRLLKEGVRPAPLGRIHLTHLEAAYELGAWMERRGWPYCTAWGGPDTRSALARLFVRAPTPEFKWASCIQDRATDIMGPAGALGVPLHSAAPCWDRARPWLRPTLDQAARFFAVPEGADRTTRSALQRLWLSARVSAAIQRRSQGQST